MTAVAVTVELYQLKYWKESDKLHCIVFYTTITCNIKNLDNGYGREFDHVLGRVIDHVHVHVHFDAIGDRGDCVLHRACR